MSMAHLFLAAGESAHVVPGHYQLSLVALSVAVAIILSWVALHTAAIARRLQQGRYRHCTMAMAAVAMGGGIWTMHFTGMLAYRLPVPVHYEIGLTVLSFVPACAASWLAVYMLARQALSARLLIVSGILVGGGIGAMHYMGMAAMQTPLAMRFVPSILALSIVVAVVLAMLALWIHFGLRQLALRAHVRFVLSGAVMGVAIAGMHYTGMAAVRFIGTPILPPAMLNTGNVSTALVMVSLTITVGMLVAALNGLIRSRQLNQEIESRELHLRAVFETAADGIITIDETGMIREFSPAAEKLFGYNAAEIVGSNVNRLVPESYRARHEAGLKRYVATRKPHIIGSGADVAGLRKDGREVPIRIAINEMLTPDNKLMFVGLVTDISERQALEQSLRETAVRAEEAATAKSSFLANMSHEIRTPMNSIIGFTDLVLQSNLTGEQRSHLDTIRRSSGTLLKLINDILDTTKLEHGRLELEERDFSLRALAHQVESSLQLAARARGLRLDTHYPADMPDYFCGDALRLQQVLTNLVNNAIKFTETGGVDVAFSHVDGHVHIEVRDTGIGMSAEQLRNIFDPFNQADATISRRFGGTGLGTTIARQLVGIMGGHINVDSTLGEGSIFRIHVPLPQGSKPVADTADDDYLQLPALRILAADDVATNRELLRQTLQRHGHEVDMAVDGAEAVAKHRAGTYDVILMDMHMPEVDGLQATRLIRQYERTRPQSGTPIIALTASVMAKDRYDARQAGMDGFAVKPLDLPRLFAEIARVLNPDMAAMPQSGTETATERAVIDWQRGADLWGDKATLIEQITLFLDHLPQQHPLPASAADVDRPRLVDSLHGIKGAAGNLALMHVSELAGELEELARDTQIEKVMVQLPELASRLALVRADVASAKQSLHSERAAESTQAVATTHVGLGDSIKVLLESLRRNELDDARLVAACAALCEHGQQMQADALRTAVDDFDFDRARALLEDCVAAAGVS